MVADIAGEWLVREESESLVAIQVDRISAV